ncbi:MAG: SDR family oxidoreductase [Anaerolineae bacterium]|nr:SDR family oxidoreductase [Anaerolineae bacterium]
MTGKILVTGAVGNVGAEVIKQLGSMGQLSEGSVIRAADLDVSKIREKFGDLVEAVTFDFAKKETYAAAFAGVETMFLLRPPQISDVKGIILPALDAAQAAGVRHVVFLSLLGIERATYVPHYKIEEYLVKSPMSWTFLRCSFFMQNLNSTHRQEIRERDELFVPVGRARTSSIDVRDIAAVAAIALSQPGHANKAYDLTGAEALEYGQVARILSETMGRKISYRNPSLSRFFLTHLWRGVPFFFALVMAGLYLSTRNGLAELVTDEVERITGRKPILFQEYAADYAASWAK